MTSPTRLLHGERIHLTALRSNDLPSLATWEQDTRFLRLYDARPAHPRSPDELAEWLRDRRGDSNTFTFGIRLLNDEKLLVHFHTTRPEFWATSAQALSRRILALAVR